jgi:probable rRNA maturation factor
MDTTHDGIDVSVSDRRSTESGEIDEIDDSRYAALIGAVLQAQGVSAPAEVSLVWVDRSEMAQLKSTHLGVDEPTDVLSFPLDGSDIDADVVGPRLVGDVVICPAFAADQAPGHTGDVDDELALLVVHGALHLVGHDHAESEERALMWSSERELLAEHWGSFRLDPWSADVS